MNWYKLHIGDYESHTSHLSLLEDGIYGRLLRRYYMTERPLPNDLKELARLVRARSRHEVDALERCVNSYFLLKADGLLHNSRADEEILKYQGQCEANRITARQRIVRDSSANRPPNQNLEPDTRKDFTGKPSKVPKKDPRACAFEGCTKPGSRSHNTSGGPFYCSEHFEGSSSGPKHITAHLPQAPQSQQAKGKFDD